MHDSCYQHFGTADPQPNKAKAMTTRLHGASLLRTEPFKSKKLNNKIHVWQIHSNLLEKNPHWVSTGWIATNGVAWGDEVDSADMEAEKARVSKVLVDKSKKRKRTEVGRHGQRKACMDTILDGGDLPYLNYKTVICAYATLAPFFNLVKPSFRDFKT